MKVSGIQVKTCNFVNFGTINEADKKRAIREGFEEKEVLQAEKMKYFNFYYSSNGDFRAERTDLEFKDKLAIIRFNAVPQFMKKKLTPDNLGDTLEWLQRIEDTELGVKPPAKPRTNLDNDEYDSYTRGGIFSRSQEREDELYDKWPLGD